MVKAGKMIWKLMTKANWMRDSSYGVEVHFCIPVIGKAGRNCPSERTYCISLLSNFGSKPYLEWEPGQGLLCAGAKVYLQSKDKLPHNWPRR